MVVEVKRVVTVLSEDDSLLVPTTNDPGTIKPHDVAIKSRKLVVLDLSSCTSIEADSQMLMFV